MYFLCRSKIIVVFLEFIVFVESYGNASIFSNSALSTINAEQALDLAKLLIVLPINETVKQSAMEMFERQRPTIKRQMYEWVIQHFNMTSPLEHTNIDRQGVLIKNTSSNRSKMISDLPGASFWMSGNPAAQPTALSNFGYTHSQNFPVVARLNAAENGNVQAIPDLNISTTINTDIVKAAPTNAATLNTAEPKSAHEVQVGFDDKSYYGEYKAPSWEGVQIPTLPGLVPTNEEEEDVVTDPIQMEEDPIVKKVKQDMVQYSLGYIPAFASELCHIVAVKHPRQVQELCIAAGVIIMEYIQSNRFLEAGKDIERSLQSFTDILFYSPADLLDDLITVYYHAFRNLTYMNPDTRVIIQEIDDLFHIREAEDLLKTLIAVDEFPENGINATTVAKRVIDHLLKPYFRLGRSPKIGQLVSDIEKYLHNRPLHHRADSTENKMAEDNVTAREIRRFYHQKGSINEYDKNRFEYKNIISDMNTARNNIQVTTIRYSNIYQTKFERNKNIQKNGAPNKRIKSDNYNEHSLLNKPNLTARRQRFEYKRLGTIKMGQHKIRKFQNHSNNKDRHRFEHRLHKKYNNVNNINMQKMVKERKADIDTNALVGINKYARVDRKALSYIYQNIDNMNNNLNKVLLDTIVKKSLKSIKPFSKHLEVTQVTVTQSKKASTKKHVYNSIQLPNVHDKQRRHTTQVTNPVKQTVSLTTLKPNIYNSKLLPILHDKPRKYTKRVGNSKTRPDKFAASTHNDPYSYILQKLPNTRKYTDRHRNHSKPPTRQGKDTKTNSKSKPHILFHNIKNKDYHRNILKTRILPITKRELETYSKNIIVKKEIPIKKITATKNAKLTDIKTIRTTTQRIQTIDNSSKLIYKYNKEESLSNEENYLPIAHLGSKNEKLFNDKTKLRMGNMQLKKVIIESSYSDAEADLKFNLNDALRHNNKDILKNGRRSFIIKKNKIKDITSESDDEGVLKYNIYKVFGHDTEDKKQ